MRRHDLITVVAIARALVATGEALAAALAVEVRKQRALMDGLAAVPPYKAPPLPTLAALCPVCGYLDCEECYIEQELAALHSAATNPDEE